MHRIWWHQAQRDWSYFRASATAQYSSWHCADPRWQINITVLYADSQNCLKRQQSDSAALRLIQLFRTVVCHPSHLLVSFYWSAFIGHSDSLGYPKAPFPSYWFCKQLRRGGIWHPEVCPWHFVCLQRWSSGSWVDALWHGDAHVLALLTMRCWWWRRCYLFCVIRLFVVHHVLILCWMQFIKHLQIDNAVFHDAKNIILF